MPDRIFTAEELECMAKSNKPMPKGLNLAQMYFYLSMLLLCKNYRLGAIDSQKAKEIKKNLYDEFFIENRMIEIYANTCKIRIKLAGLSKEVYDSDCDRCKKLMRIFDNMDGTDG